MKVSDEIELSSQWNGSYQTISSVFLSCLIQVCYAQSMSCTYFVVAIEDTTMVLTMHITLKPCKETQAVK